MAGMICEQPNGLYCRFSTVVDTITHHNMTREDYIELCKTRNISEWDANDTIDNYLRPFSEILQRYIDTNMPVWEFKETLLEMGYNNRFYYKKNEENPCDNCEEPDGDCACCLHY